MFKLTMILVIVSLASAGHLVGWGNDLYGQISDIPTGEDFVQVECYGSHAIALRSDSTICAWGINTYGQGEIPDSLVGEKFLSVATGGAHNVAIRADSTLVAWGYNSQGQGEIPGYLVGEKFISVALGSSHSIGIKVDGKLAGWGYTDGWFPLPDYGTFVSVAAYGNNSIALHPNDWVDVWGVINDDYSATPPQNNGFTEVAFGELPTGLREVSGKIRIQQWDITGWIPNGEFPYMEAGFHGLTVSASHGFVIDADSTLRGWGYDSLLTPELNEGFLQVSAGHCFTVGIQEFGTGTGIAGSPEPTLNLSVLANPSASPVIQFTTDTAAELSIYDISGRTVLNENYGPGEHNARPIMSTGIYFVRLSSTNSEIQGRLTVLQ